jgi:hypothetical protein
MVACRQSVHHLDRWIDCTPLSANVFVTLARQQHLEYLCTLFLKHLVYTCKIISFIS